MKKKVVTLSLVVALIATAAIGGTFAYFTDTDDATNTFTVGNVDIDLTEPKWDNGTQDPTDGGEGEAQDVYPGEALAKDPTVTNIGKNPCFVRLQVTNLDQYVAEYGPTALITLRHGEYVPGYDTDNWELYNGYYYYKKPLATKDTAGNEWNQGLGTVTEPLFNQIVIPAALTNNEEAKDIEVFAEAVQAQGAKASWSAVKAMTVAEIDAWFTTCGM